MSEQYYVIPYKTDPPIVVDGNLGDWANVPNAIVINTKEHVTFGTDKWKGPADLSGTIHLAWRNEGIFLAAEVIEDRVNQPYGGGDIWKGDHVNLWMDFIPGVEPERTMFGAGQFHFVVSPGNFGGKEGERVIPPEIYVYRPEGLKQEGGKVAARRTDNGYTVEAYVPFSRLGVPTVKQGQDANFEVALSHSQGLPAKQDELMTFDTRPWAYSRNRLVSVVFGDGNGKGAPPVRIKKLLGSAIIPLRESKTVEFAVDPITEGKEPYIFFKAREEYHEPAGFVIGALAIELNGQRVEGARISNRPRTSTMMGGQENLYIEDDGKMIVWYTPSFTAIDSHSYYGLVGGVKACEYEFAVGGLLKTGANALVFKNLATPAADVTRTIHIGDVELRVREKAPLPAALKPAPTGDIPVISPQMTFPKTYSLLGKRPGSLEIESSGERFSIASRFSAPDGKWHEGSTAFYRHTREVVEHDEWIEVRDTFKNLTPENVPIMQEHSCVVGRERMKGAWLGCLEIPSGDGDRTEADNPSVFAATDRAGIGMVPLNDEFRVHSRQAAEKRERIRLSDAQFVLRPGAEYTAELAIVPVPAPDVWAFVNAARRMLDVNFQLKYMYAFFTPSTPYFGADEQVKRYIQNKSASLVVESLFGHEDAKGHLAYGAAFQDAPLGPWQDWVKRMHKLFPDGSVKTAIYYHCFLDTREDSPERFKDDRALDASGTHINYGGEYSYMREYVPTLDNAFGRETAKNIDVILDKIGADGIYWDEFAFSAVRYVYNKWDGCSADIDPTSFKITRLKGSTTLLSRDFRAYHVKRILARACPFYINGAPHTRTLSRLKFQAFTETGSITNCRIMLLYSPVALGDHLTEVTELYAYKNMLRSLDHGCLYAWYHVTVVPTHKTLTEYMYPFTPIELHSGYVIGKERILTNRSGLFGWGDKSDFETHVFDREGKETAEFKVPRVERDGKTYAVVRIPEGYAAAIVRSAE